MIEQARLSPAQVQSFVECFSALNHDSFEEAAEKVQVMSVDIIVAHRASRGIEDIKEKLVHLAQRRVCYCTSQLGKGAVRLRDRIDGPRGKDREHGLADGTAVVLHAVDSQS